MVTDRDAGSLISEQWLAVLDAVAEACAAERANSASTGRVSLRIQGVKRGKARTLLRVLRRRGYLDTMADSVDGAPLRWALTPAGRSVQKRRRPMQPRATDHGADRRARAPVA
jgi:hypothetical protein